MPYPHRQRSSWTRIKSSEKISGGFLAESVQDLLVATFCKFQTSPKEYRLGQLKSSLNFQLIFTRRIIKVRVRARLQCNGKRTTSNSLAERPRMSTTHSAGPSWGIDNIIYICYYIRGGLKDHAHYEEVLGGLMGGSHYASGRFHPSRQENRNGDDHYRRAHHYLHLAYPHAKLKVPHGDLIRIRSPFAYS